MIISQILKYCILFPLIIQIVVGSMYVLNYSRFNLKQILVFNILLNLLVSILFFFYELNQMKGCLNPMIGIIGLIIFSFILILTISTIQYIIYRILNHIKNKNVGSSKPQ